MPVKSKTVMIPKSEKNLEKIKSKSSRMRRQRGYHWEDTIVKRFNSVNDWKAFRLGSPSTGLPDVLAVSTKNSIIFTIEAKSGTGTSLPVPADQIERCNQWVKTFDIYKERKVILAFKFLSKKRIGTDEYKSRELREFFKIWDDSVDARNCVCTYDGDVFIYDDHGERKKILLKNCEMPFKIKLTSNA